MQHFHLKKLVFLSLCICLSFLLSFVVLFRLPQGGSISLECIPLLVAGFLYGAKASVTAGVITGILHLISGKAYVVHYLQFILDYPVAFGLIGVCGFFKKGRQQYFGLVAAFSLRYLAHVASGIVFFSQYAPEGFNPVLYSMLYNSFVLIQMILSGFIWFSIRSRIQSSFLEFSA